ncbi:MAG: cytochrome C oxidase subunit IV family protein [Bryobacteraceae bacterium]|nr:cytochrome C oxidase subunit IV family protein [Bryobacteraceae bacterium]
MTHHVEPRKVYFGIFAALMVLTALTVLVAMFDLGRFNIVVALSIACAKAFLVVMFFMHLRFAKPLTQVMVAGGLLWLVILLSGTITDYISRGWLGIVPGW